MDLTVAVSLIHTNGMNGELLISEMLNTLK
jgi:hypothetical protein